MPLSEYEQRVLDQMERQLTSDDPGLVTSLSSTRRGSGVRYLLAAIGIIVGIGLLILGVAQSQPVIGVVGFAIMFLAVVYAFTKPAAAKSTAGPIGSIGPDGRLKPAPRKKKSAGAKPFMAKLEERWDRRRDQGL